MKPNKPWIALIPELAYLLQRDKGSKGDAEGRKKLQARKEFIYIYFYCDFGSPIRDYDLDTKKKEALIYAQLEEKDIDKAVLAAIAKYNELQVNAARSLRTYKNMLKGLDAMDLHFETLDFSETDKLGRPKHTPESFAANILKMNKVYEEMRKFEKRVDDDLKNAESGIRGNAELGDNETRRTGVNSTWNEAEIGRRSAEVASGEEVEETYTPKFSDLSKLIHVANKLTDDQIDNGIILERREV